MCDFGLARFTADGPIVGRSGTPAYMPPEMLRGAACGEEADVWSLGVISSSLLVGYHPFDPEAELDDEGFERRIVSGSWDFDNESWAPIPAEAKARV